MSRIPVLLLSLLILPACSLLDGESRQRSDEISVTNSMLEPVYVSAVELSASHLMDIRSQFDPEQNPGLAHVAPGSRAVLNDIYAYEPGDDILLLVYALRKSEGVELAMLVATRTITADDLEKSGGEVTLVDL